MTGATSNNDLDAILDAAQQAWAQGQTLLAWVQRYPHFTLQLSDLAVSLQRQASGTDPAFEESASAALTFLAAMRAGLADAAT